MLIIATPQTRCSGNIRLIGDNILVDNEESLFICVDSIRYNVDNYINNHDLKFFMFY